ncbi:MAG: ABC transporter ATP-binding protein [Planctomycetes bacterium]|nr:ABC transporter ATP-binding protein [Planctomycetota bacterium]
MSVPETTTLDRAAGPPVLAARGLVVRYGRKEALKGVDVSFHGGSLGLLGPNGAGKSTFLRAILGLLKPDRGSAAVLGFDSARAGLQIRAQSGYMPESDCHVPGLSGVEFTAYCGRISGLGGADARRRAHEVLVYVGLQEERYRKVEEYSRGMRQKVKLAAALVHDPAVLFLDEPTSGLDPQARQETLELIRDLAHNKGMHVVLSSHLLKDVETVCDEVIVLAEGQARTSGRIDALKRMASGFVVRVDGEVERFARSAQEAGLTVERDGRGALLVQDGGGAGALTARALFALGRAAGTPLRHVVPAEESLEDLFLRALAQEPR